MSALNPVALGIGWAVLAAAAVVAFSAAWWGGGDLVWRLLPEGWRAAQKIHVPQPRYGSYIQPMISRKALALMFVLGGPYGWLQFPHMLRTNRAKRKLVDEATTEPDGGGDHA